jgi:hypothetical protein
MRTRDTDRGHLRNLRTIIEQVALARYSWYNVNASMDGG